MRVFKFTFLFLLAAFFVAACNKSDVAERVYDPQNQPYEIGRVEEGFLEDDELVGPESLDLQAVGGLLERANNAEDFEYLLNSEDGINNLDLNDDGYADYIGVREFGDENDDERGFSLFSMFGPNLIQEIASIIFNRNRYDNGSYYPGSRVLIRGNDYLYGDNYYYETNWLDRQVPFNDWVFADRDNPYNSPYYYGNYPGYYEAYEVVETPVYLTRVEQYYYSPVFAYTPQPTITQYQVVSPYQEVSLSRAFMTVPVEQLAERRQKIIVERTNQLAKFKREKPAKIKYVQAQLDREFMKNQNRFEKQEKFQNDRPEKMREMREMRDKPGKPERLKQPQEQQKFERQQQKFERQQQKVERQQQRFERPQQQKIERQQQKIERPQQKIERPQQMKQQRPQKQEVRIQPNKGGGNPNKGGGNPNKGGGGGSKKGKP